MHLGRDHCLEDIRLVGQAVHRKFERCGHDIRLLGLHELLTTKNFLLDLTELLLLDSSNELLLGRKVKFL